MAFEVGETASRTRSETMRTPHGEDGLGGGAGGLDAIAAGLRLKPGIVNADDGKSRLPVGH